MATTYTWQDPADVPAYRSSNRDHLRWWAAAAMLVSVLLHVVVFFALDQVKFALGIDQSRDLVTKTFVNREQERSPLDFRDTPQAPDHLEKPAPDLRKMIDDIDIQDALKDQELEVKPEVLQPQYNLAPSSLAAGAPDSEIAMVDSPAIKAIDKDFETLGRTEFFKPASIDQPTVIDPGSMKAGDTSGKFIDDIMTKGAGGKAKVGTLDGIVSLDNMIGLPAGQLIGSKTMLPSDLLFEFNKFQLRESAKFGLQKLGLLIDNNPSMYCWIEGHTDLIGGDEANLELSKKRAEAVKEYLVTSMGMNPERIITRGFGRFEPIIPSGDQDQQSPNRRVEIKMRKTPPPEGQIKAPKASVVEENPPPRMASSPTAPPAAIKVTPNRERGIPVEVMPPPKARAIEEPDTEMPPRALPVAPERKPARAIPVAEPPVPRAEAVPE